jgi:hypothetical protein
LRGAELEVCSDYIQALEECHARGFIKLIGGCNQAKKDLSMCLRKEVSDLYNDLDISHNPFPHNTKAVGNDDRRGQEEEEELIIRGWTGRREIGMKRN